jgi:hypothetical protein
MTRAADLVMVKFLFFFNFTNSSAQQFFFTFNSKINSILVNVFQASCVQVRWTISQPVRAKNADKFSIRSPIKRNQEKKILIF